MNKLFIGIVVALMLPLSAAAADSAKKGSAPKAQPAPEATVEPKPLPTPEEAVRMLAELDKAVQTLRFDFEQTLFFDETGLTREVAGNVRFEKPGKIRIEHSKPQPQIVYTDKKIIIIYKPADAQAVKTSWQQWLSQQSATLTGIADLGDYATLAQKHDISLSRDKQGRLLFALRPKNNPKAYTLTLTLAEGDYFPGALTFTVGKTRFETVIKNVARNEAIPAEVFEFKQPPGVDLIDLTEPARQ